MQGRQPRIGHKYSLATCGACSISHLAKSPSMSWSPVGLPKLNCQVVQFRRFSPNPNHSKDGGNRRSINHSCFLFQVSAMVSKQGVRFSPFARVELRLGSCASDNLGHWPPDPPSGYWPSGLPGVGGQERPPIEPDRSAPLETCSVLVGGRASESRLSRCLRAGQLEYVQ